MAITFPYPLLVLAGIPRTGSTTLYENLANNPGFVVPNRKELNFFRRDGTLSGEDYMACFPSASGEKVRVDASPYYSCNALVPSRIQALAPNARIVLFLREPIEWLKSLHNQFSSYSAKTVPFDAFTDGSALGRAERLPNFSFSDDLYRCIVTGFSMAFRERLLVLDYRLLERDLLQVLQSIEKFAGAASWFEAHNIDNGKYNSFATATHQPRLLRYLLSREPAIRTAQALLPPILLRAARHALYGARRGEQSKAVYSQTDRTLAAHTMSDSVRFYNELFQNSALRSGSEHLLQNAR